MLPLITNEVLNYSTVYCTEPAGEGIYLRGEVTVQEGVVGAKKPDVTCTYKENGLSHNLGMGEWQGVGGRGGGKGGEIGQTP